MCRVLHSSRKERGTLHSFRDTRSNPPIQLFSQLAFAEEKPIQVNQVTKSSTSQKNSVGDTKPEWYEDLNEQQISMFKEVST
jgi:hypothetical protein